MRRRGRWGRVGEVAAEVAGVTSEGAGRLMRMVSTEMQFGTEKRPNDG